MTAAWWGGVGGLRQLVFTRFMKEVMKLVGGTRRVVFCFFFFFKPAVFLFVLQTTMVDTRTSFLKVTLRKQPSHTHGCALTN